MFLPFTSKSSLPDPHALIIPETRLYCSFLLLLEQYYSTSSLLIILNNGANISLFVLEMLQLAYLKSLYTSCHARGT